MLAFAIGLHELAREADRQHGHPGGARQALAATPLAAVAVGAIYSYSFPGLLWLAGAAGLWAVVELGSGGRSGLGRRCDGARQAGGSRDGRRARRRGDRGRAGDRPDDRLREL